MPGKRHDVIPTLAERRDVDRNDVQTVEEVLAEQPFLDSELEWPIRGRDDAQVHLDVTRAADAPEHALLEDPQELRLAVERHLAHFVQEERPPVGELHEPLLGGFRVGEGAFLVTEQLTLEERLRDRRAVDFHEGKVPPRALVVQAARHELLTGPAVAQNQDRLRLAPRDLADQVAETTGGFGVADDLVDSVLLLLEPVQPPDLAFRPDLVEGASDGKLELFDVLEGLLEVIGRADLDGLHCALDLAEARDDDHSDLGVAGPQRPEDVHAVHVREAEVEEDEVWAHLVGHLEPFLPRRGSMDLDLILAQDPGHQGPDVPLVVYHEDVIH